MMPEKKNEKNKPLQISPNLFKEWVQVQKDELDVRQQELHQNSQEAKYSFEYSKLALESDERNFTERCSNQQSTINKLCWFLGLSTLMAFAFMGYLVHSGNPGLVVEILKGVGYIGAGGAGGYGLGRQKGIKKSVSKE